MPNNTNNDASKISNGMNNFSKNPPYKDPPPTESTCFG